MAFLTTGTCSVTGYALSYQDLAAPDVFPQALKGFFLQVRSPVVPAHALGSELVRRIPVSQDTQGTLLADPAVTRVTAQQFEFMVRSNSEDQTTAKGGSSALHSKNSLTGGCKNTSLSRVSQSFTAPDKHQEFPRSK